MPKTAKTHPPITTGSLARIVRRSPEWVRAKSDQGLIPHMRDEHGNRLFDRSAAADAALRIIAKRP